MTSETRKHRPLPELKQWMDARGLTQGALAGMLGKSEAQMSRWLSGHRAVPIPIAIRLSDLTGIPVERLANSAGVSRILKLLGSRSTASTDSLRKHAKVS